VVEMVEVVVVAVVEVVVEMVVVRRTGMQWRTPW
jgi:hypothetical protein